MGTHLTNKPGLLQPETQSLLVDVVETSAAKGEWATPAAKKTSLALALSNFSARWRGSRGLQSQHVSSGTMAICELDRSRHFEMKNDAKFGIVMVSNKALEQAAHGARRPELQPNDMLQDLTLLRLTKILLAEKRSAFRSGLFFLDGVTSALVSYLLRHYSVAPPLPESSSGGLPPSALRRCVELMEERIEGNLRLEDLANEVGFSTSHLIRSFRQSTGKTPYQFLLHQRIERARSLMRDLRTPLTEVALACGFADQHHLARVFRRITGLTPTDYRRSL